MTNAEKMVEMLYSAQDDMRNVTFSVINGSMNIEMNMIPDICVTENWIDITDQIRGMDLHISFYIPENDVEYDADLDEFSFNFEGSKGSIRITG